MSILNDVQLADSGDRSKGYDPVRLRRKKLAAALQDQLNLLEASEEGDVYRKVRIKRERDLETDLLHDIEQQRRVSPWWWVDDEGTVKFSIRYGSAKLIIKDGKDAVVLTSLSQLRKILPALRQEVLTGAFDAALASAAENLQGRFKARKKGKA